MNNSDFQEKENEYDHELILSKTFSESDKLQSLEYLYEFNKYPQTHPEYQAIFLVMIAKEKLRKKPNNYFNEIEDFSNEKIVCQNPNNYFKKNKWISNILSLVKKLF